MSAYIRYQPIALGGGAGGGGVTTVGTIDSQVASANGAVIVGSTLYMQSASQTVPGLVNLTTQIFAGDKAFTGKVAVGTTATGLINTREQMSVYAPFTTDTENTTGETVQMRVTMNTSVGNTYRPFRSEMVRTTGANVADNGGFYGGTFGVNFEVGAFTWSNTNPIAALQIHEIKKTGAGALTMPYTSLFITPEPQIITGRKGDVYLGDPTNGSVGNAHLHDNWTWTGNWFINSISTNPSTIGGALGIGVSTTPAAKLDVLTTGTVAHFATSGANDAVVIIDNTAGGNACRLAFQNAGTTKYRLKMNADNSFAIEDTAHSSRDALTIETDGSVDLLSGGTGNVGIGKTAPTVKLDVAGNGLYSGLLAVGSVSTVALLNLGGGTNALSGVTQVGLFVSMTSTSGATTTIRGVDVQLTQAPSITTANLYSYIARTPVAGAGGTITRAIDFFGTGALNHTATNNATFTDNNFFTGNWFINQGGTDNSSLGGTLTAPGFIGPLTGNVTGNVSGTAATVTTAAQPAITSVGTLTSLTLSGLLTSNDITMSTSVNAGVSNIKNTVTPTSITGATTGGGTTGGGTANFNLGGSSVDGLILVTNRSTGGTAMYMINGGSATLTSVSDPASKYSNTPGTASKDNLSISGVNLVIEHNSSAATHTFRVTFIGL